MSKKELLEKTYSSACAAMHALNEFLAHVDKSCDDESRGDYQHLKAIGNRIYE